MSNNNPIRAIHDAMSASYGERHQNKAQNFERGSIEYYQALRGQRLLEDNENAARVAALNAFAALNGWKIGKQFPPEKIGRYHSDPYDMRWSQYSQYRFFDHCHYFRADRRNAAILTQPYDHAHADIEEHRAFFAELNITLHVPPDSRASFHFPGWTCFLVLTAPGIAVRWLPEQHGELIELWKPSDVRDH